MKNQKGQVTLFVIIGLILLIIVGIVLYLNNKEDVKQVPTEDQFKQNYGANVDPLVSDVEFCLDKLGEEAFKKVGMGAGYIKQKENLIYNHPIENQNNALQIFPDSDLIVPYWLYIDGSPNCGSECTVKIDIPSLEDGEDSIKSQVEMYIDENINECVNNFESYKESFDTSTGKPKSTLIIRDSDVFIGLEWEINVTFFDGTKTSLKKFSDVVDVKIKNMYRLATDLINQMELVGQNRKLETFTMDVIDYLALGGQDAVIPPREGPIVTELEAPTIWKLDDVKETIGENLAENIPFIQVFKARESYYPFTDNPYEEVLYTNFQNTIFTNDEYLDKTKINFNYFPTWPLYVSVSPSAGPIIMPESSYKQLLMFTLGFTRYKFSYDISYPVLITLEDNVSFGGEGYTFQFAYETNVRNNKPYTNETINLDLTGNEEGNAFGDYLQRTVPLKLTIYDGYSLLPVENIPVIYSCGDSSILVGVSELEDGLARIDSALPPCIGGSFSVLGEDYVGEKLYADMILDEPKSLTFKVYPKKEFDVELGKRMFTPQISETEQEIRAKQDHEIGKDREWKLITGSNAIYPVLKDEEILIILTEIINGKESDHVEFLTINSENIDNSKIKLTPGLYKYQLVSTLKMGDGKEYEQIIIPKRTYEVPDDFWSGIGLASGGDVVIDKIVFNDSLLVGGITFDPTTSGYLDITADELKNSDTVTFYYASYPIDSLVYAQDLTVLGQVLEASVGNEDLFKPEFS